MAKNKTNKIDKPMTPEMIQMANAKLFEFLANQNFGSIEEANEFISKHINGKKIDEFVPLKKGNKSNIEKSDDLIYEAYESEPEKGLELAKESLSLNPNNIRAINYLADQEEDIKNAIKLYRQSMIIGAKQLGEKYFIENSGHFWGLHETRPYMTAKFKYADCLNLSDKVEESIKELKELLVLNPNDNQGVRYMLSSILLVNKKYEEYYNLYKSFKEEQSSFWLFDYALYLFITKGETSESNKALQRANKNNKHVLQFMTQQKEIPEEYPEYYSPGSEEEAVYYLRENLQVWVKHLGTIGWIMGFYEKKMKK